MSSYNDDDNLTSTDFFVIIKSNLQINLISSTIANTTIKSNDSG